MNRKRLFKKINELCLELSDRYDINNGGCCFVAACIAEQLERFNIPFEIIHYDVYHCHYCIKVSDRYLNRDDFKKNEISEIWRGTSEELFDIYYDNSWNEEYDTDDNDTVKSLIQKVFEE